MAETNDSPAPDIPLPARRQDTLGLVIFRRLAAHGLNDARATMLAREPGGPNVRRMLILSRALVVALARASPRRTAPQRGTPQPGVWRGAARRSVLRRTAARQREHMLGSGICRHPTAEITAAGPFPFT